MKKIIFTLVTIFMFSNSTFAENVYVNNLKEIVIIELNIQKGNVQENVNLKFNSIEDFKAFDTEQLSDLFDIVACTASVSVTVSIGIVSVTVAAENIPCDEIGSTIKMLYKQAMQAIQ